MRSNPQRMPLMRGDDAEDDQNDRGEPQQCCHAE